MPVEMLIERSKAFLAEHGIRLLELDEVSNPPDLPKIATIRLVDISAIGSQIDAMYSKARYEVKLNDHEGLAGLLNKLAKDNSLLTDIGRPRKPFQTQLSLQNRKLCYVIFKLAGKNWQFSSKQDPFSIGIKSTKPQDVYFEPRKVDKDGNIVPRYQEMANCKIAYFIANGPAAYLYGPDPFNFHLDFVDKDHQDNPSPIPVIVDPDVRYPGGSGADGNF